MTNVDHDATLIAWLRRTVDLLAAEPAVQLEYLREAGVQGLADELALQFDDAFKVVADLERRGALTSEVVTALRKIDEQVSHMTAGPSDVWSESAVRSAPEWHLVRAAAQRALSLIPSVSNHRNA